MTDYSTDDANNAKFWPHGRVQFTIVEDGIILYRARGPFNTELYKALEEVEPSAIREVKKKGNDWCEIVVFEKSCLASNKSIDTLRVYMKGLKDQGLAPLASAHVFEQAVEGAYLMRSKYENCYAESGIMFSAFDRESDAFRWVKNLLSGD